MRTPMVCADPLPLERLIDYSLGELSVSNEGQFETHLFECESCSQRLEALDRMTTDLAEGIGRGIVNAAVTGLVLARLSGHGAEVRHYRINPGEKIACTAAPADDFVAIRLAGDFEGISEVHMDIDFQDLATGQRGLNRVSDVPVDRTLGEVLLLFPGDTVRAYPRSIWTVEVRGRRGNQDTPLGVYTLDHTPWEELTREL